MYMNHLVWSDDVLGVFDEKLEELQDKVDQTPSPEQEARMLYAIHVLAQLRREILGDDKT